ncbi:NUDIX domain-containing protein [Streptomyces sp. NPDC002476]|uniref:NUDIX domain-containing protein n=1 Tax=Streptomyces sp. NPDC002476 TaxID=3364648 RepID=UPI003676E5B6
METTGSRPGVSAGAVIRDEQGRVLIVDPVDKPYWNLPGGHVEEGEEPHEACGREVREELGLNLPIGRLLVHAAVPAPGHTHEYFVFDGGVISAGQQASIQLQESELRGFRFAAPGDITEKEIPPAARGMWEAALVALREGRTIDVGL